MVMAAVATQIRTFENKASAGNKLTDERSIPNGWSDITLSDAVTNIYRGASPRPINNPAWFEKNSSVGWVRIGDVTGCLGALTETSQYLSNEGVKRSRFVPKGSLIMSICATVGRPVETAIDVCIHDGFVVFEKPKVQQSFLYHVLRHLESTWVTKGQTGSQMNLNTNLIKSTRIAVPDQAEEQCAIAEALSDQDALIESLKELIKKKRLIRQGVMQELLTCKQRLSGHVGDWVKVEFTRDADLNARIGWQGLTTAEYCKDGEYYLVTGTEIVDGSVKWEACNFINKLRYDLDKNIQVKERDVLVTKDGTIGKVAYIEKLQFPATLNSGVFVIRAIDNAFDQRFLSYVLQSHIFSQFLLELSAGSTINHLYQKDFLNFSFFAPPTLSEQKSICEVLSEQDEEIAALVQKLDKARQLRQGIMQNLLTGKTRLI